MSWPLIQRGGKWGGGGRCRLLVEVSRKAKKDLKREKSRQIQRREQKPFWGGGGERALTRV